jgi:tRNA(Ile)-lysidine synthase
VYAIAKALQALPEYRYLLAVSGGRDSMALLHAFREARPNDRPTVGTFDHGSGAAATSAADLVVRECLRHGIPVVSGHMPLGTSGARRSESAWRAARWSFLRAAAAERRATIVTAHTLDDQAETVAMRILRGASARGLAAMAAPAPGILRPLLAVRRAELAAYAAREAVPFVEDPSNVDAGFLRNRLRADLMHAAERAHPGFSAELTAIGARAAAWRRELADLSDALGVRHVGDVLVIDVMPLASMSRDSLAILWPEVAGRVGVVMDRRGVARAAAWTPRARAGQRIPLSGGASLERTATTFVVHAAPSGWNHRSDALLYYSP